ncbi:MAG TPA: hypothetical protein VMS22_00845 [Candidatus Eisenbacteria bacterium]|nr:hypothetical protein [Candidatus Eisenbacteria bacterium]
MRISRAILGGERPIFWWGQSYLGTLGNYVTAGVFGLVGESIPAAALVSLAVWGVGVGLATALALRLFGARGAWWTAALAAIGTPYANHYVTQPYSSYETAAVMGVLSVAAVDWTETALSRFPSPRAARRCAAIGAMLGVGWWTTRLFAPVLLAWALGTVLVVAWRRPGVRAMVAGGACLVAGFVAGDVPELLYRADPAAYAVGVERLVPLSDVAPMAVTLANTREGLLSLPAYVAGDPRSRLPEGISFAESLGRSRVPPASTFARIADAWAVAALLVVVTAAALLAVRGWQERRPILVALGATPFIHLALIVLSAATSGGYFEARRYWFALLLIVPLLAGGAVIAADRFGARARQVVCLVLAVAGAWSVLSQARMLLLPDELAAHRALAQDLVAEHVRYVVMPTWTASVLDPLSGGELAVVTLVDDRNPAVVEAARAAESVAVVAGTERALPEDTELLGGRFARDGAPRHVERWSWARYRRVRAGDPSHD